MMKPNITPVGTFQRITSTAPLRAETREAIQNTVLQFYVQNSQLEDDSEGLTACYERLSQDLKKHPKSIRQRFVRNFRSCLTAGQSRLREQREMRFCLNIRMLPKLL